MNQLVELIKALKKDEKIEELQRQFFDQSAKPLKTKQQEQGKSKKYNF